MYEFYNKQVCLYEAVKVTDINRKTLAYYIMVYF